MDATNDINLSLRQIRENLGKPIYEGLLDIQQFKKTQIESENAFFDNLECLSLTGLRKGGQALLQKRKRRGKENYIAVSYTWSPEEDEDGSCGGFAVENPCTHWRKSVEVRDGIMKRTIRFLSSVGRCELFWIDRECVNQDKTTSRGRKENEEGLQAMGLVYQYSKFSIALLNRCIKSAEQLILLYALMSGNLVYKEGISLTNVGIKKANKVLKLVDWIASTSWWKRAWTFHEDYKAGVKMIYLIRHSMNLERQKDSLKDIFGNIPGELRLTSTKFREETTRFCLALRRSRNKNHPQWEVCQRILKTAGKYTALSEDVDNMDKISKVMSWRIFEDVGMRQISQHWDRLDIAANCCNYAARLHRDQLESDEKSLSLAFLAVFLLNGEIMLNSEECKQDDEETLNQNIFSFLRTRSDNTLESPVYKELTFFKGCRFENTKLTELGIQTKGHLWILRRTFKFRPSLESRSLPQYNHNLLSDFEIECLKQLAENLRSKKLGNTYPLLAKDIEDYYNGVRRLSRFAEKHMSLMASSLVSAMFEPQREFMLGCPVQNGRSSYHAIFVSEEGQNLRGQVVFTAASNSSKDLRDVDKYVNLRIGKVAAVTAGKEVVVGDWMNGLCFLQKEGRTEVTFGWPEVLKSSPHGSGK